MYIDDTFKHKIIEGRRCVNVQPIDNMIPVLSGFYFYELYNLYDNIKPGANLDVRLKFEKQHFQENLNLS